GSVVVLRRGPGLRGAAMAERRIPVRGDRAVAGLFLQALPHGHSHARNAGVAPPLSSRLCLRWRRGRFDRDLRTGLARLQLLAALHEPPDDRGAAVRLFLLALALRP